jgi:hypothetical protein
MAIILNREGRRIHIWKDKEGLHLSGHLTFGWRVRGEGDCWKVWDPPGGPCIVAGMRLEDLHEDFKGLIVTGISASSNGEVLEKCSSL